MQEKIKVLVTYRKPSQEYTQLIGAISDRIEVEVPTDENDALKAAEDAEIVFGGFSREMFLAAKKLRWVHAYSAGVDSYLFPELVNSQVILTHSSGIHRIQVSEIVFALMLALAKKLHKLVKLQSEAKWERLVPEELAGKTIGILGLGNIGMETAWKAKAFGMRVLAVEKVQIRRPTYVDELFRPEELENVLHESDYLAITVPLTKETYHLVGEKELRLMKPTAYIVNVARGAVVDSNALLKALKEGWIAGAGLDVFEQEPLPKDSEFWTLENAVITPHIAGSTPQYEERAVKIFCDNLKRYLVGKPLINVVDKETGY